MKLRYRIWTLVLLAIAASSALWISPDPKAAVSEWPSKLADREFWRVVEEFSEPGGFFRSDNFVSNESSYQHVIPEIQKSVSSGGAYIGVGPDQNFSYIAAVRPGVAFIVDIRRQNMIEHLLFKALFELSDSRTEFLSRLFSRPLPKGFGRNASIQQILGAFNERSPDEDLFEQNLREVLKQLTERHGFRLKGDDPKTIEYVYRAFLVAGPDMRYSFPSRWGWSRFPSYAELVMESDAAGQNHNYLATEENFLMLKKLHTNNLIIPLVGDFAGKGCLRAVAEYLKDHGLTVSAFYTSNVEFYLFQSEDWKAFLSNVSSLPVDERSTFIRSYFNNYGYSHPAQQPGYRSVTLLDSMRGVVEAFDLGQIRTYSDLILRSR